MTEDKNQRVARLNHMLLEMASGNFFYRLERSMKNDNVEALIITLNMLAEEIQETLLHQGYVNSNRAFMDIVQMSFILDEHGLVQMINQQTCNILSVLYTEVIGKLFDSFLIEASRKKWQNTWKTLMQKGFYDTSLELTFRSKGNLVIPKTCHITTFMDKNGEGRKILVTIIF